MTEAERIAAGLTEAQKPILLESPNQCPGSYSLHLYCKYRNPNHGWDEFPWQIDDFQTYGAAARYARRRGWILHRDGLATCPKCRRIIEEQNNDH